MPGHTAKKQMKNKKKAVLTKKKKTAMPKKIW